MRDQLFALVAGAACAAGAWAFWHYLGSDALNVMLMLALAGAIAENLRLRRKLRDRQGA